VPRAVSPEAPSPDPPDRQQWPAEGRPRGHRRCRRTGRPDIAETIAVAHAPTPAEGSVTLGIAQGGHVAVGPRSGTESVRGIHEPREWVAGVRPARADSFMNVAELPGPDERGTGSHPGTLGSKRRREGTPSEACGFAARDEH